MSVQINGGSATLKVPGCENVSKNPKICENYCFYFYFESTKRKSFEKRQNVCKLVVSILKYFSDIKKEHFKTLNKELIQKLTKLSVETIKNCFGRVFRGQIWSAGRRVIRNLQYFWAVGRKKYFFTKADLNCDKNDQWRPQCLIYGQINCFGKIKGTNRKLKKSETNGGRHDDGGQHNDGGLHDDDGGRHDDGGQHDDGGRHDEGEQFMDKSGETVPIGWDEQLGFLVHLNHSKIVNKVIRYYTFKVGSHLSNLVCSIFELSSHIYFDLVCSVFNPSSHLSNLVYSNFILSSLFYFVWSNFGLNSLLSNLAASEILTGFDPILFVALSTELFVALSSLLF